jgi:antirestriction protein
MIQDWEVPAMLDGKVSECSISNDIPEILTALANAIYDIEVYEAFAACFGPFDDVAEMIKKCEESYAGEFDSDAEFAENMADECGMIETKVSWPYTCIDWDWAARELMYDYSADNGHYFRSI